MVVTRDGRPAGWAFVTTAPRPREGWPPLVYAVTPPPGLAYVFDVFVLPGHRGLGLARELVPAAPGWRRGTAFAGSF